MPGTFSQLVTVVTGQTITAALWNNEFQNVITNCTPSGIDDDSSDISAMQATTDPYPAQVASLATDMDGEIQRLRYLIAQITGMTYWYQDPNWNGWHAVPETWTYATANTFTISGDYSAVYQFGDKVKLTNSTVKYFYIIKAVHSAGTTTVTVEGGSTYTLANAAISSVFISREDNPLGFPGRFSYTPTFAGGWGTVTNKVANFRIQGKMLFINGSFLLGTVSAAAGTITMPTTLVYDSASGQSGRRDLLGHFFILKSTLDYHMANRAGALIYNNAGAANLMTYSVSSTSTAFDANDVNVGCSSSDYVAFSVACFVVAA